MHTSQCVCHMRARARAISEFIFYEFMFVCLHAMHTNCHTDSRTHTHTQSHIWRLLFCVFETFAIIIVAIHNTAAEAAGIVVYSQQKQQRYHSILLLKVCTLLLITCRKNEYLTVSVTHTHTHTFMQIVRLFNRLQSTELILVLLW